jgi:hypothetical protein
MSVGDTTHAPTLWGCVCVVSVALAFTLSFNTQCCCVADVFFSMLGRQGCGILLAQGCCGLIDLSACVVSCWLKMLRALFVWGLLVSDCVGVSLSSDELSVLADGTRGTLRLL